MKIAKLTPFLSVSPQIAEADLGTLAAQGFRAVINNRPDGEAEGQPASATLAAAAERVGLDYRHVRRSRARSPTTTSPPSPRRWTSCKGPVLAFCRTGTRSTTLWALAEARHLDPAAILPTAADAGYDLDALQAAAGRCAGGPPSWLAAPPAWSSSPRPTPTTSSSSAAARRHLATASSLLRRRPSPAIAVIEPRERHYYQPGWTLVGGGVFDRPRTERSMATVMPKGVTWIRGAAAAVSSPNATGSCWRTASASPIAPYRGARDRAPLGGRRGPAGDARP